MRSGFPLRPLLLLRERRETMAMQVVASTRAALNSRQMESAAVQSKLAEVEKRRRETLGRAATIKEQDGIPAFQMVRYRDHAELLRDREATLHGEVKAARQAVDAALDKVTESQYAYRRERAKRESIDLQKTIWHRNQTMATDRQEESVVEELVTNRIGQKGAGS